MNFRETYTRQTVQLHGLLLRCRFHMMEKSDKLHPSQMKILIQLLKEGRCNQRRLVQGMGCSAASVAMSVKRLEKSGYLEKTADPQDLRSSSIALTSEGRKLAQESLRMMRYLEDIQFEGFSEEELKEMVKFQERMIENIKRFLNENKGGNKA